MTRNPIFRRSTLAVGLALAASTLSVHAADLDTAALAAVVYGGGEAMAPEAQARLNSLMTTPGGAWTRAEARQAFAEAQQAGTLAAAGEIADTPQVLVARADFNQRQTREILARHEAERQRLAAIEAERVALAAAEAERQRLAALPVEPNASVALASGVSASESLAAPSESLVTEPVQAEAQAQATATPPVEESPTQTPSQMPVDRPPALPVEVPISRADEVPSDMLIDTE